MKPLLREGRSGLICDVVLFSHASIGHGPGESIMSLRGSEGKKIETKVTGLARFV